MRVKGRETSSGKRELQAKTFLTCKLIDNILYDMI